MRLALVQRFCQSIIEMRSASSDHPKNYTPICMVCCRVQTNNRGIQQILTQDIGSSLIALWESVGHALSPAGPQQCCRSKRTEVGSTETRVRASAALPRERVSVSYPCLYCVPRARLATSCQHSPQHETSGKLRLVASAPRPPDLRREHRRREDHLLFCALRRVSKEAP